MSTLGVEGAEALPVVSFSHFIPQPRLYYGNPRLKAVMGCPELGRQVKRNPPALTDTRLPSSNANPNPKR